MNKKLGLAVASALLAAASSANAGISIPAGDWTVDIGGVVNAYYTSTSTSGDKANIFGGVTSTGSKTESNITTGLLPNVLSISGKTRANDLDVGFTIAIDPGASTTSAGKQSSQQENRQAFLTFGDKSWGTIKLGKDIGIYAQDAILNDMTLLGVGSAAGALAGNTTTLGRIGTGFVYTDWKAQASYYSPNWNGFSFAAGLTQAWNAPNSTGRGGSTPAFEAKASYDWAGDVAGKVWASTVYQRVKGINSTPGAAAFVKHTVTGPTPGNFTSKAVQAVAASAGTNSHATAFDIGANVNMAGFGLTGYYNKGKGIGTTVQLSGGFDANGKRRDSDDWYVQGTYTIPGVGTKLGLAYGESTLDGNKVDTFQDSTNTMWTLGAYHPLTKNLNLVAEYSDVKAEVNNKAAGTDVNGKSRTIALGAILFF